MKVDLEKPFAKYKDETLIKWVEVIRTNDISEHKQLKAIAKALDGGRFDAWSIYTVMQEIMVELSERLKTKK